MPRFSTCFPIALLLCMPGCITRIVTVKSDPPGALVYLNDEEVGRTPVSREFQWYGTYDVLLRKEGYQTKKTYASVSAPLWQFIPLDLLTDLLPVTDEHVISFKLTPEPPADPAHVLNDAEKMRMLLESSERTKVRVPKARPATQTSKRLK